MSAMAIAGIVFVCVFGGALLGVLLSAVLPKHHLSEETRDLVRLAMATIATMAALVVGLLIASAKSSFDTKDNEIKHIATQVVLLDRTMAEYGPEVQDVRKLVREIVAARIRSVWNEDTNLDVTAIRNVPDSIQLNSAKAAGSLASDRTRNAGCNQRRCRSWRYLGSALVADATNRRHYPVAVPGYPCVLAHHYTRELWHVRAA